MKSNFISLQTIVRREITRFMRIWTQTLVPPMLTSLLFIVVFGYSLGSRISSLNGISYIEFILPGLVMMSIIQSAYASTSFSLYIQKFQGSIQELLVAPVAYWQIIAGQTIAAVVRSMLVGLGIILISLVFTSLHIHSYFFIILFTLLVSMLFAFAGIATALWANNFDQMNIFSTFVITPLTYLGGVFYSLTMLPNFWQKAIQLNPILYMVDGFRYGFLGVHDLPLWLSTLVLTLLTLFFFVLCVQMFKRGYKLRT